MSIFPRPPGNRFKVSLVVSRFFPSNGICLWVRPSGHVAISDRPRRRQTSRILLALSDMYPASGGCRQTVKYGVPGRGPSASRAWRLSQGPRLRRHGPSGEV